MFKILFVCTGNWFRSRFAEIYFNHMNLHRNNFSADSRGMDIIRVEEENCPSYNNEGFLSVYTGQYLDKIGVSHQEYKRKPLPLTENDLLESYIIICMDEKEHKPMMEKLWPEYSHLVRYWNIGDMPKKIGQKGYEDNLIGEMPDVVLPKIKQIIDNIICDMNK